MQTLKSQNSNLLSLERRGYKFGAKIGKGSYGHVVKASYSETDKEKLSLACKYIDTSKAPKDFLEKFFPREIDILKRISHPNVIDIHSILQCGPTVFIFMRFAENGDLLEHIKRHGAIEEPQAKLWFYQMVNAIRYIHSLGYAHRDLKCENLLISRHLNIKIADFGFTRKCVDDNNKKLMSSTFCGSAGKTVTSTALIVIFKSTSINF
jgi:testis-specific serine kinase